MKIGTAMAEITPKKPLPIAGMMKVRLGEYVHDPLMISGAAFESEGRRVVVCSCDLLLLPDAFVRQVQSDCEKRFGIDGSSVIIACTHTHQAPCTVDLRMSVPRGRTIAAASRRPSDEPVASTA